MTIHNHEAYKTAMDLTRQAEGWRQTERNNLLMAKEIAESAFCFAEERYPNERIETLQDAIKWLERSARAADFARQFETAADDAMRDATAEPEDMPA